MRGCAGLRRGLNNCSAGARSLVACGKFLRQIEYMTHFNERMISIKVVAWANILFFGYCSVAASRDGEKIIGSMFLIFVLVASILLLNVGAVEIDEQVIYHKLPLSRHCIRWDEIIKVEIDKGAGQIAFEGNNKRLVILGPVWWSRNNKTQMFQFLSEQVKQHQIEMEQTQKALYKISHNAKGCCS